MIDASISVGQLFKHEKSNQKEISHKISKTHEADKAISMVMHC